MSSLAEKVHTDELAATALGKPALVTAGTNGRPVWFTNDMLQAAWGRDNNSGASGAYCPPAGADRNSLITHVDFGSHKTAIVAFPGTHVMADVPQDASFATKIIPGALIPEGTTKKGNGDRKVNVSKAGIPLRSLVIDLRYILRGICKSTNVISGACIALCRIASVLWHTIHMTCITIGKHADTEDMLACTFDNVGSLFC